MTLTPAIDVSTETSTIPVTITRMERAPTSRSVTIPIALMTSAATRVQKEMKLMSEVAMPAGQLMASTPGPELMPLPVRTGSRRPRP